jgi:transcription elongation factor SPT5
MKTWIEAKNAYTKDHMNKDLKQPERRINALIAIEKAIIFNLTRKSIVMENGNAPLQLLSCFCRDSLKGYIYLEAERQAHVAQGRI